MLKITRKNRKLEGLDNSHDSICIVVICNSKHHSRNLIHLSENLAAIDNRVEVFALCEVNDAVFYKGIINQEISKVILLKSDKIDETKMALVGYDSIDVNKSVSRLVSANLDVLYKWILRVKYRSKSNVFNFLVDIIKESTIVCYLREKRIFLHYTHRKHIVERIFEKINPTIVFSFGDRHIDIEAPVLMAAKTNGIRIIIPYSTYSGSPGMIRIRQIQKTLNLWWPFSLYRLYSVLRLRNQILQGYFWQHPSVLFALKKLNSLSDNPWCIGNGLSDIVCVDNEYTYARYRREGVPSWKLRVVGDVAYDSLFEQYSNRKQMLKCVRKECHLEIGKPVIVLALPQFAEQGLMDWERHWKEINYICNQVTRINFNVIISLHPRVNSNNYSFLEGKYPVHISLRPLKEILPIANVFIAINSSTVFWAVLCGIPTIVLDYFGLDSTMFANLSTVKFVRDRNKLFDEIVNATNEAKIDFTEDWEMLSREKVFDGKVVQRYYKIITDS